MTDTIEPRWTVYTITDPATGLPFYVGQTVRLDRRIRDHLKCRTKASSATRINAILQAGNQPQFTILHTLPTREEADHIEFEEIAIHLAHGHQLTNADAEVNHARKRLGQHLARYKALAAVRWPDVEQAVVKP